MAFKFDSHSCYVQTRALAERHRTFDAVPAHHGLIEQPGDSACQTMDTSLAAFGVKEEKAMHMPTAGDDAKSWVR